VLKIKSDTADDIGSHKLQMNAIVSNKSINFTVNVIFKADVPSVTVVTPAKPKIIMKNPAITLPEADKFLDETTYCTEDGEDIL